MLKVHLASYGCGVISIYQSGIQQNSNLVAITDISSNGSCDNSDLNVVVKEYIEDVVWEQIVVTPHSVAAT